MAKKKSTESNKLKIVAYSDVEFSSSVGEFQVMFNPNEMTQEATVEYDDTQPIGSSGTLSTYSKTPPETIKFDLLLDSTIKRFQINSSLSARDKIEDTSGDIQDELDNFRKVVFDYNGQIHRPNFLKLFWGKFLFKGQLTNLDIKYEAFNPQGKPLRATLGIVVKGLEDVKTRLAREGKSSPDLTHVYTVQIGDTLPMIAQKIYSDPMYYLDIAKVNNLNQFRGLAAGQSLILPPIEK